MIIKKLYQDICEEIDTLQWRIEELEAEHKMWWSNCFADGIAPLDVCLKRMEVICDQVEFYSEMLDQKERSKKEIEQRMSRLSGLEGKVMYKRVVEGKSLQEIADELGYSVIWIKKLSSRSQKKIAV